MTRPVYILINPKAQQGKAWKRWQGIRARVLERIPGANEMVIENGFNLESILAAVSANGCGTIISAGGDGSVHFLVNTLFKDPRFDKTKISVGAIGLGSSNDFHKPFQASIDKIPVRINTEKITLHDAGKVNYVDEEGNQKEKYFIVNASFGATAQGNWNFNNPGGILRWLKKTNTAAAINYTSLSTILSFKNRNCQIQYDGVNKEIPVSNINILKIPFVAGTLHYNQPIQPDDGKMGLNICQDMSRLELIQTMMGLEKGRFNETNKKISTYTDHFILEPASPAGRTEKSVVFECDGETEKATRIEISLIPKAIQILAN